MEPDLAQFGTEQPGVNFIHVNIEEKDGPHKEYLKYYNDDEDPLPYTLLLDKNQQVRKVWDRKIELDQLRADFAEVVKEANS